MVDAVLRKPQKKSREYRAPFECVCCPSRAWRNTGPCCNNRSFWMAADVRGALRPKSRLAQRKPRAAASKLRKCICSSVLSTCLPGLNESDTAVVVFQKRMLTLAWSSRKKTILRTAHKCLGIDRVSTRALLWLDHLLLKCHLERRTPDFGASRDSQIVGSMKLDDCLPRCWVEHDSVGLMPGSALC